MTLLVAVLIGAGASGCGSWSGDCSDATPDGQGGCIPSYRGPIAAQSVAKEHFGVHSVACFEEGTGPFSFERRRINPWLCEAIKGGAPTHCLLRIPQWRQAPLERRGCSVSGIETQMQLKFPDQAIAACRLARWHDDVERGSGYERCGSSCEGSSVEASPTAPPKRELLPGRG